MCFFALAAFLGPTRVSTSNGISIGSAVFAGFRVIETGGKRHADRFCRRQRRDSHE